MAEAGLEDKIQSDESMKKTAFPSYDEYEEIAGIKDKFKH